MKIALVTDGFDISKDSGIARYSSEIFSGLTRNKIDVDLFSIKCPHIPYGMAVSHSILLPAKIYAVNGKFDIFHATSPILGMVFPLITSPKIATFHDLSSILSNRSGVGFHAALSLPFLFKAIAKNSDRIIAVSQQTKDELRDYLGISGKKITVINLGIDERFKPIIKKRRNDFIIGYVGTMAPRKRLDQSIATVYHFIKNYQNLNIKFHIYGPIGQDYPKLLKLANNLHISDCVEFKGFIPDNELVNIYNSFDVLLMSSQWEGFCMPILESQRCGIPVVIRDDARIPVEVTKCCLRGKSEIDTAELIYNLLADSSERSKIISSGIDHSKTFTWNKHISQTLKVYEDVY